jgi:hypothetical protein
MLVGPDAEMFTAGEIVSKAPKVSFDIGNEDLVRADDPITG